MKGKRLLSAALALLLLSLAGCGSGGQGNAPNYNWSQNATQNAEQSGSVSDGVRKCELRLLDDSRKPVSNKNVLVFEKEPKSYYIRIANLNEVDVDCTVFAYQEEAFIPLSIEGGEPADYYVTRLAKKETVMLPVTFHPKELPSDQPAVFLLGCALADTNRVEIMRSMTAPAVNISNVFTQSLQMQAADKAAEVHEKTEDVDRNGIRSEYINDGTPLEERDPLMSAGLSFGEKLDASTLFSIRPQVQDTEELYLRAQSYVGVGKCTAVVFVDNVPVKAFDGKTFASHSRKEMEAYSFPIDKSVLPKGEHTLYGICFYDDSIKASFTEPESATNLAEAFTMSIIDVK